MTLVEMLAAVAILGLAAAAFLNLSHFVLSASRHNDKNSEAMQLAENFLNSAREAVMKTGSISDAQPPSPVPGYSIYIQMSNLSDKGIGDYETFPFENKQHVSLQGLAYHSVNPLIPRLITVTVYWEE